MSDYSSTFGGAAKDAANDIILGSDFDTEFDAIATASATKANKTGAPATTNNLAMLTATGDLADSLVESVGSGNITANVTGDLTGNADTATASLHGTIQVVTAVDTAFQTSTTAIPLDDTIPTTSEGLSLVDVTITPKYADSELIFTFSGMFGTSANLAVGFTIVDVTGTSTIYATGHYISSGEFKTISFTHAINSPGTSANTYRIRFGSSPGTAVYANGSSGSRKFGGVAGCRFTVTEIRDNP